MFERDRASDFGELRCFRVRDGCVDRDHEPQFDVHVRQRGIFAEEVHDAERTTVGQATTHLARPRREQRQHLVMRLPRMQGDRFADAARRLQLPAHHVHLATTRRQIAIEIKSDLADNGDSRVLRHLLQRVEIDVGRRRGIVRVDADGGEHAPVPLSQGDGEAAVRGVDAERQDDSDAGFARALDHSVAIRIELRVVDVAVRIDEAHIYADRRASPSASVTSIFLKSGSGWRRIVPGAGKRASHPDSSMAPSSPRYSCTF